MSKKYFEALAAALKFAHPGLTDHDTAQARATWADTVNAVADACQSFNGAFDRARFVDACVPAGRVL